VQERVTDRVAAPVTPKIDPGAGKNSSEKLTVGVEVGAAYDDNIFLSAQHAKSDMVFRVSPSVSYTKGDPSKDSTTGGYVRIAYKPSAIFYMKNSGDDRVDQQAGIDAGWHGQSAAIDYSGGLQRLSDATADTGGGQTKRLELRNTVRLAWTPREKITWELGAGQSSVDYQSPKFFDSRDYYGEGVVRFNYSPKTRIGLGYRAGTFEVDGAGRQVYQQVTGQLQWKPREKIQIELQAGAEHRTFDAGSSNKPVVEGRITWMPRQNTELYLTGYRRENASAYLPGENFTTTGGTVGIAQKFGEKWTARLEGGVERAAYTRVSGVGAAGREDRIYFIKPSLEYQFTDQVRGGIFYRYAKNRSNESSFGYDDNTAGAQIGYEF
jgi:hypothetical protein